MRDGEATADGRLAFRFAATAPALTGAQARLSSFLDAAGLSARIVGRAELLVEELVLNVVQHAGLADPGAETIGLEAVPMPSGGCRITLDLPGPAFDPTAAALPARPGSIETAEVGGLGLVLLRRLGQDLAYARLPEGRNRVGFSLAG